MIIAACLLLATAPIAGCATLAPTAASTATPLERADAAYQRIRAVAVLALPLIPAPYDQVVSDWIARADRARAAARLATDAVEQLRHLRELEDAVIAIRAETSTR
jgi:hypothetical protein